MKQFPKNFLWGAATSSYQVEGNNQNADWWPWELKVGHQPSADACGHYERFKDDFDLAKSLHHNAHRFSVEWSRVEPSEGQYSQEAINHYVDVVKALRERGIEPIVTLHHFTNPIWLSSKGGWTNSDVISAFERFSAVMAKALGPYVAYWNTINEPTIYFSHSYIFGWWPPQGKSLWQAKRVHDNMIEAHVKSYRKIHAVYQEMKLAKPLVGFAHHMCAFITCHDHWINRLAIKWRNKWLNFEFVEALFCRGALDFIGFNYYSRQLVDVKAFTLHHLLTDVCKDGHLPVKKNSLGWDIYPEGIYGILMHLKKYKIPIVISENGICTNDDTQRTEFIKEHLKYIHQAISEGVDVRGYMYWSLLDNFEWDKGYKPHFGLIEMDYATQKRTIKPSAFAYAKICQTNILE